MRCACRRRCNNPNGRGAVPAPDTANRQEYQGEETSPLQIWQRNYYEHVIRDEDDLDNIRQYIANNPLQWAEDENNPIVTVAC